MNLQERIQYYSEHLSILPKHIIILMVCGLLLLNIYIPMCVTKFLEGFLSRQVQPERRYGCLLRRISTHLFSSHGSGGDAHQVAHRALPSDDSGGCLQLLIQASVATLYGNKHFYWSWGEGCVVATYYTGGLLLIPPNYTEKKMTSMLLNKASAVSWHRNMKDSVALQ